MISNKKYFKTIFALSIILALIFIANTQENTENSNQIVYNGV